MSNKISGGFHRMVHFLVSWLRCKITGKRYIIGVDYRSEDQDTTVYATIQRDGRIEVMGCSQEPANDNHHPERG